MTKVNSALLASYAKTPQLFNLDMKDGTLDGKVNGIDVSIFAGQQSGSGTVSMMDVFTAFLGVMNSKSTTAKKESVEDILAEMKENVPAETTTIEEKNLALGYIGKILKSDADDETKDYWKTKKQEIYNELIANQQIEAQKQRDKGETPTLKKESADDVIKEMSENIPDRTTTVEEKSLALSYIGRIMVSDADKETKTYWNNKSIVLKQEIAGIQKDNGGTTTVKQESSETIIAEMKKNVPDRTSTIKEKELALSYIERIQLSDADDSTKSYWSDKAKTIQQEITNIQKEQSA